MYGDEGEQRATEPIRVEREIPNNSTRKREGDSSECG